MSATKRARENESAGAAAGGAGGGQPPPWPPQPPVLAPAPEPNLATLLLSRDVGFGDEPLSLVVAFLAPRDRERLARQPRDVALRPGRAERSRRRPRAVQPPAVADHH